jgi:tetratricopeptide (TPR) repeat protein
MFRPLDDRYTTPSEQLRHFTNRVSEQAAFQRLLDLEAPHIPPVLMFYGIGGTGKSWLLKKLRERATGLPTAYIDLDPRSGGTNYLNDTSKALAELRRQFGAKVKCPRFDLAYTWLRHKEGVSDEPHFRGTGLLGNSWEFVVEAGNAAASDIPGASLVSWLIKKVASPITRWLKDSGVGDWLATKFGQDDFLRLKRMLANDIYPELRERLLKDLKEELPERDDKQVRGVVFLDTVEVIRGARDSESMLFDRQQWLKELYHPDSRLLVVLAGRDRLDWGHDPHSDWARPDHLEQHLVGGLSRPDALEFLTNCEVTEPALQEAILRVSLDVETEEHEHRGYHAFTLGLCADTCWNHRQREESIDPATFDMAPEDTRKLAARFLRSLGGDGSYAHWLQRLALAPRFDETAARAAFGSPGTDQNFAWQILPGYSFVRSTDETGWFTLHLRMRDALADEMRQSDKPRWTTEQQWWQAHWSARSTEEFDGPASLAWYHRWELDPNLARLEWQDRTRDELRRLQVSNYSALLDWWTPCHLEERLRDSQRRWEAAAAFNSWGIRFCDTPLGSRAENLQRAIECYTAGLRVRTESDFPEDWAMTQSNLGTAYHLLPIGIRESNVRRAIDCYTSALRVYTEADFPEGWAMTQHNLGTAYNDLPMGNRVGNVQRAIDFFTAALRVRTKANFPQKWAMTQNNLGNAYSYLPTGDRGENLQRAIDYYSAAVRVYTEADFPRDWARTQNNLGNAYADLPMGDQAENLRRAIDCYTFTLRVRTEANFPQDWATTQNNLGNAYSDLATGDRAENLQRAIDCYTAALQVRTEADFPQNWAETTANLALAERDIAREWQPEWCEWGWDREELWSSAERRLRQVITKFEEIGHQHYADKYRRLLNDLRRDRDKRRRE